MPALKIPAFSWAMCEMVFANARDGRDFRRDDVGAVEPTAQPGFDHGNIDLLIGEPGEGHGGEGVEASRGRPHLGDDRLELPGQARKLPVAHHFAIDREPFADVDQMRAGVKADLIPAGLEHRGNHRASAAFAFGPGHMDGLDLVVRIAQFLEERPHAIEVEVLRGIANDAEAFEIAQRRDES
jgi:hypothetical protein